MNTIEFVAKRRGVRNRAVIIRGKVPVSPAKQGPYLAFVATPRNSTRTFALRYREQRPATPDDEEVFVVLEHEEPSIPDFVDLIRILLPDGTQYEIHSMQKK